MVYLQCDLFKCSSYIYQVLFRGSDLSEAGSDLSKPGSESSGAALHMMKKKKCSILVVSR